MSANSTFQLFSSLPSGGFFDEPPLPPPPPSLEILSSEVSRGVKCAVEPVNIEGLTLLKGRVSTKEVLGLPNSDLVPGVYEGGLKLWEGSLDLVKALRSEVQNGNLSFEGKRGFRGGHLFFRHCTSPFHGIFFLFFIPPELGCGHGLPGIFASLEGATAVHFQDFNAEVLPCLTIPNVNANLSKELHHNASDEKNSDAGSEVRFFAGDWSQIHECLPHAQINDKDHGCSSGQGPASGYDIILMAETIYSVSAQQHLYVLIKKCVSHPHGAVYMAAKKYYFGVGGGTRQFLSIVEKDGFMTATLVDEVTGASSNVREVWKLSIKQTKNPNSD